MSKTTKTVLKNVTTYQCDICGKNARPRRTCRLCGKTICKSCRYDDYNHCGDYAYIYCKPCWEIGESYRIKIEEIENIADKKIDNLTKEWYAKC